MLAEFLLLLGDEEGERDSGEEEQDNYHAGDFAVSGTEPVSQG
jgi:hypothetical protein